jgi:hypothetical protein
MVQCYWKQVLKDPHPTPLENSPEDCSLFVSCLAYSSTMNMEAANSFETSVNFARKRHVLRYPIIVVVIASNPT